MDTLTFNGFGPTPVTLTSDAFLDEVIAHIQPTGTPAWITHLGAQPLSSCSIRTVTAAPDAATYVVGTCSGSFQLGSHVIDQQPTVSKTFLAKLSP